MSPLTSSRLNCLSSASAVGAREGEKGMRLSCACVMVRRIRSSATSVPRDMYMLDTVDNMDSAGKEDGAAAALCGDPSDGAGGHGVRRSW